MKTLNSGPPGNEAMLCLCLDGSLDVHYVMVILIAVIPVEMSMIVGVNKWQVKTFGNLSKSQNQTLSSFPKKSTSLGKSCQASPHSFFSSHGNNPAVKRGLGIRLGN